MRTSAAADLQDAVEIVVSLNSFSFPALRPFLHKMAGGKIFPFNLAGSLPRGISIPPAHINHAKLYWARQGREEEPGADKMAATVHSQANLSGST